MDYRKTDWESEINNKQKLSHGPGSGVPLFSPSMPLFRPYIRLRTGARTFLCKQLIIARIRERAAGTARRGGRASLWPSSTPGSRAIKLMRFPNLAGFIVAPAIARSALELASRYEPRPRGEPNRGYAARDARREGATEEGSARN